jgi:hypothetical protein
MPHTSWHRYHIYWFQLGVDSRKIRKGFIVSVKNMPAIGNHHPKNVDMTMSKDYWNILKSPTSITWKISIYIYYITYIIYYITYILYIISHIYYIYIYYIIYILYYIYNLGIDYNLSPKWNRIFRRGAFERRSCITKSTSAFTPSSWFSGFRSASHIDHRDPGSFCFQDDEKIASLKKDFMWK